MHQYIYIKIYTLSFSNFEVSCGSYLYKGTLTFIPLSLLNCDLFTLGVQILVMAPEIMCEEWQPDERIRQLQGRFSYYCLGCIVDFVVLLFYLICVDRSGSLSSSAFNQLKLVTLNIVLTILYSLKPVSQMSLLQCLNSSLSSTKSSNIYSRHPYCNIK